MRSCKLITSNWLAVWGMLPTMLAMEIRSDILVVDQDPSNQAADHQQLQPAIDAAQAGDTIYVMPSAATFEDATVEKSLTFIGAGMAREVAFPEASSLESRLGGLTIKASDVFVTGFVFAGEVRVLAPSQNITIFRNFFDDSTYSGELSAYAVETPEVATTLSNLHVINNRFRSNSSSKVVVDLFHSALDDKQILTEMVGFVFANNFLVGGDFDFPHGSGEIYNNYFSVDRINFRESTSLNGTIYAEGRFFNNIVHRAFFVGNRLVATHNAYSSQVTVSEGIDKFFADASNLKYTELSEMIVNEGAWGNAFVPTAGSLLKGAGMNGEDIGIFGGPHAWNLNHQPPVPIITKLQAPRIVGTGENLSLQIEVQPNN